MKNFSSRFARNMALLANDLSSRTVKKMLVRASSFMATLFEDNYCKLIYDKQKITFGEVGHDP